MNKAVAAALLILRRKSVEEASVREKSLIKWLEQGVSTSWLANLDKESPFDAVNQIADLIKRRDPVSVANATWFRLWIHAEDRTPQERSELFGRAVARREAAGYQADCPPVMTARSWAAQQALTHELSQEAQRAELRAALRPKMSRTNAAWLVNHNRNNEGVKLEDIIADDFIRVNRQSAVDKTLAEIAANDPDAARAYKAIVLDRNEYFKTDNGKVTSKRVVERTTLNQFAQANGKTTSTVQAWVYRAERKISIKILTEAVAALTAEEERATNEDKDELRARKNFLLHQIEYFKNNRPRWIPEKRPKLKLPPSHGPRARLIKPEAFKPGPTYPWKSSATPRDLTRVIAPHGWRPSKDQAALDLAYRADYEHKGMLLHTHHEQRLARGAQMDYPACVDEFADLEDELAREHAIALPEKPLRKIKCVDRLPWPYRGLENPENHHADILTGVTKDTEGNREPRSDMGDGVHAGPDPTYPDGEAQGLLGLAMKEGGCDRVSRRPDEIPRHRRKSEPTLAQLERKYAATKSF